MLVRICGENESTNTSTILPYRTDVSMFRLRSNVLLLLLLAVARQQVALSSSSIADEYAPDSEVLLAEEEESSSSSVDTLELEIQLVALKESHRDESLPPVRSWHVACNGGLLCVNISFLVPHSSILLLST